MFRMESSHGLPPGGLALMPSLESWGNDPGEMNQAKPQIDKLDCKYFLNEESSLSSLSLVGTQLNGRPQLALGGTACKMLRNVAKLEIAYMTCICSYLVYSSSRLQKWRVGAGSLFPSPFEVRGGHTPLIACPFLPIPFYTK